MQYRHLCWPLYFFLGPAVFTLTFLIIDSPLVVNCAAVGLSIFYSLVLT